MKKLIAGLLVGLALCAPAKAETDYVAMPYLKRLTEHILRFMDPHDAVTNLGAGARSQSLLVVSNITVNGGIKLTISPVVTVTSAHQFAQAYLYTNVFVQLICSGSNSTAFLLPPPGPNLLGMTRWLLNTDTTNALVLGASNMQTPATSIAATGSLQVLAVSTSQWRRLSNP